MTVIKLTQDAYFCGGHIQVGIVGLDEWYQAGAEDAEGNAYRVIWQIKEDYSPESENESDACDWGKPWAILDEYGANVAEQCRLA